MASCLLSYNNNVVSPPSPPPLRPALFRKCRISLKNTANLSFFSGSLKCKSMTAIDLIEPEAEPRPKDKGNIVYDDSSLEKNKKPRSFWKREWLPLDVLRLVLMSAVHLMCLYAPFCFSWHVAAVGAALAFITGVFGIILSYHRHLSHRSFTIPKWLEYLFAYCGVLAMEGNPIDWVSTHRNHHKFADTVRDPHSPMIDGFWFSHISWILDRHYLTSKQSRERRSNVDDLRSQAFYRFLEKTYYFHPLGFAALLYAVGGLPMLVWGFAVRVTLAWHITFLGTSVLHLSGEQSWNTGDSSRNNWWVALLTFGDGWHNNHHAFEYSARHGLEWWQVDVTWGIIRFLEVIGLATDVKLPTKAHKESLARRRSVDNPAMQSF